MAADTRSRRVVAILDRDFGERLRSVWQGSAVWIVRSRLNDPVIEALRAEDHANDRTLGITTWTSTGSSTPEEHLLSEIDMIDLHHGPYSSESSYTTLEAVGAALTVEIREALSALGFTEFAESKTGFVASRSVEEAEQLRPG